jgi:hypothetical protein
MARPHRRIHPGAKRHHRLIPHWHLRRLVDTAPTDLPFEAPAGAWEAEILPARVADYEAAWLGDECLAGRVTWARLQPRNARPNSGERGAGPVRTTPIALLSRRHARLKRTGCRGGETCCGCTGGWRPAAR